MSIASARAALRRPQRRGVAIAAGLAMLVECVGLTGCAHDAHVSRPGSSTPTALPSPTATWLPPNGLPGLACGSGRQYRPTEVAIACGDNGARATRLRWHGWTVARATATGTYVENDCLPTCVAGHLREYPDATFQFLGPLYDNQFSRVLVTFSPGHVGPQGRTRFFRYL